MVCAGVVLCKDMETKSPMTEALADAAAAVADVRSNSWFRTLIMGAVKGTGSCPTASNRDAFCGVRSAVKYLLSLEMSCISA
jgi:hypothetical protein